MKESTITTKILKWLNAQPHGWGVKLHGGAYQQAGLPDILGILAGRTFFLETKKPGGKTTAIQDHCHKKIRQAGGEVHVVYSLEEAKEKLRISGSVNALQQVGMKGVVLPTAAAEQ